MQIEEKKILFIIPFKTVILLKILYEFKEFKTMFFSRDLKNPTRYMCQKSV